jgi:hypothetical protein
MSKKGMITTKKANYKLAVEKYRMPLKKRTIPM